MILVLAPTLREAHAYGQSIGKRVRHATNPTLVGGNIQEIVELPSWDSYRGRHGVNAAIKSYRRRRPQTVYTVAEDWDYAAYSQQRQAELTLAAVAALGGNELARRQVLFDAANRAVVALADELKLTVEEVLRGALAHEGEFVNPWKQVEELPLEAATEKAEVPDFVEAKPARKPRGKAAAATVDAKSIPDVEF